MSRFQPADHLRSRTYIGLLVAQFLAAFNDQAIHAAAMFYAINTVTLTEGQAISLMPILFYAPWALFGTVAGYLADKYSKRSTLIFWKFSEIPIAALALFGFWLGRTYPDYEDLSAWLVLAAVFLMGTHSAFFVPAKYGVMPEILTPRMLSRGNGLLESLSFLAIILGTVFGGVLSTLYRGEEVWIGVVLLALAVIGALASLLIARMPPANPDRPFPPMVYGPLYENVKTLVTSRPLAFAVLGIAFFTFIVAFMRATVYMHGSSQVPVWDELWTSVIVGMVAFGIGVGSPLVGYLSGGKVELGLIPVGAVGMVLATAGAAVFLDILPGLIVCIIAIGFFTGFYLVPLFTLLQHRAPKSSKGDAVATSNFINVTGAIVASLVFFAVDITAQRTGFAPLLPQKDLAVEELAARPIFEHGRPHEVVFRDRPPLIDGRDDVMIDKFDRPFREGDRVQLSVYELGGKQHYRIRAEGTPQMPAFDKRHLPQLLFLCASALTLVTLMLLWGQLADLFYRTSLWLRWRGKARLESAGGNNVPGNGPVLIVTNAPTETRALQVLSCIDRVGRYLMIETSREAVHDGPRTLATVLESQAETFNWQAVQEKADWTLERGELVALPLVGHAAEAQVDALYAAVQARRPVPVVPVFVEVRHEDNGGPETVYVVVGPDLPPTATAAEARAAIRRLGEEMAERRRKGEPPLPAEEAE